MSVWAPPSAQQYPAQPSTAVDALMNRIRKLEGLIAELTKGSPLRQAGMGVSPGQVDFNGDIVIGGRIFTTGSAEFSGNTKIGGSLEVTGTLSLPAGIINNEALASPADFARSGGGVGGFTVTTGGVDVATQTLAVPAGYSRAIIFAIATASCRNSGGGLDYLYVGAKIGTVAPNTTFVGVAAGSWGTAAGSATRIVSGLNGGTITVTANLRAQVGSWSDASNSANVDVLAIFLR